MSKFTLQLKRLIVVTLLLMSLVDATLPVMADAANMGLNQQVLPTVDGQYGANLNNVAGATVTPGTTYANIYTPGQASYLQWNSLNVAPGQTMNYEFGSMNATSINSVIGGNMTRMAGNLTVSGYGAPTSRVIWSNPNGILFENGSYTNANALLLTTQEIKNFDINTLKIEWGLTGAGTVQIGQGDLNNAAVMRIASDLNIIAPAGILVNGADILAGDVKLITADGVVYKAAENKLDVSKPTTSVLAGTGTFHNANSNDKNKLGSTFTTGKAITIDKASIAVKDTDNGRVYFLTRGVTDAASVLASNSAIRGKMALDVDGNATFNVMGNLDIVGLDNTTKSRVGGDLTAKTIDNTITLKNYKAETTTTSTTTLGQYLISQNGNNITTADLTNPSKASTIKAALKTLLGITGNDADAQAQVDLAYTKLGETFHSVSNTFKVDTNTTASGKGSVSIKDTEVKGTALIEGAGVYLSNLKASIIDATSTAAGNYTVSFNSTDNSSKSVVKTNYKWDPKYDITPASTSFTYIDEDGHSHILTLISDNNGNYYGYHVEGTVKSNDVFRNDGKYYTRIDGHKIEVSYVSGSGNNKVYSYSSNIKVADASDITVGTTAGTTYVYIDNDGDAHTLSIISVFGVPHYAYTNNGWYYHIVTQANHIASAENVITLNTTAGTNTLSTTRSGFIANGTSPAETSLYKLTPSALSTIDVAAGDIKIQDSVVTDGGALTALARGNITLSNTSANSLIAAAAMIGDELTSASNKVSIEGGSKFGTAKAFAADIDVKGTGTEVNGGTLKSSGTANITDHAKISGATVTAANTVTVNNATIDTSSLTATGGLLSVSNGSSLNNATLTGNSVSVDNSYASGTLKATATGADYKDTANNNVSALNLTGIKVATGKAGADATLVSQNGSVSVSGSTLGSIVDNGSITSNAATAFNITNSTVHNDVKASSGGTLSVTNGSQLNTLGGTSSLTSTGGNVEVNSYSSVHGSLTASANNNFTADTCNLYGQTNSLTATNGNVTIGVSTVGRPENMSINTTTATAGNNVIINDSTLNGTSTLTATNGNIAIKGADLGATTATAEKGSVEISKFTGTRYTDGRVNTVNGKLTVNAGTTATIADTTVTNGDVEVTANGTIDIDRLITQGTTDGALVATSYGDIYVSDSTIKGDLTATSNELIASASSSKTETSTRNLPGDVYKNLPDSKYTITKTTSKDTTTTTTTDTKSRGDVRIERTTAGGNVDVDAKNITISDLTAKTLNAQSYAASTTETKQVDTTYHTTTTTYKSKRGPDENLGSKNDSSTVPGTPTPGNPTYSGGTLSLTDITLANGVTATSHGETTIANTLTANAASDLTARGIIAGTTQLTSTKGSVTLGSSAINTNNITGNLTVNAGSYADIADALITGVLDVDAVSYANLLGVEAGTTTIDSTQDNIAITTSKLGNTAANAHHDITITGSELGDTTATAGRNIKIQKNTAGKASTLNSLIATASGTGSGSGSQYTPSIYIADSSVTGNASLTSNNDGIGISKSSFGSISNAQAKYDINIANGSSVTGATTATSNYGDVTVDSSTLSGQTGLTATRGDVTITSSTLGDTTAIAGGNIKVQKKAGGANTTINSLTATASGYGSGYGSNYTPSIYIADSTVTNNAILKSNNDGIGISKSQLGNVSIKAANDITVDGSTIGNSIYNANTNVTGLDAGKKVEITNTTVKGNLKANAGTDITIKGLDTQYNSYSAAGNVDLTAKGDITLDTYKSGKTVKSNDIKGYLSAESLETTTRIGNKTVTSRNDVTINDTKVARELKAKANDISISDSQADHLNLEAIENIPYSNNLHNFDKGGNIDLSNVKTTGKYSLSNINADNTLNIKKGSDIGYVRAFAADINVDDSSIGSYIPSLLSADNSVNVYGSEIDNTYVKAENGNILVAASRNQSNGHNNDHNYNTYNYNRSNEHSDHNDHNNQPNGSTITNSILDAGNNITISDSTVTNSFTPVFFPSIKAGNDISIYGSGITNSNVKAVRGNITVGASQNQYEPKVTFIKNESRKGHNVYNDHNNNQPKGSTITNSILDAHNNITISDSKVKNTYMPFMPNIKAGNDINIYGSTLINSNASAGNNITVAASGKEYKKESRFSEGNRHEQPIKPSLIIDSKLNAGNNINISDSGIINTNGSTKPSLIAGNNIKIKNSMAVGNLVADAGNDITIKKSITMPMMSGHNNDGSVTLTAKGDIKISKSLISGNLNAESTPTTKLVSVALLETGDGITYETKDTRGNVSVKDTIVGKDINATAGKIRISDSYANNLNLNAIADTKTTTTIKLNNDIINPFKITQVTTPVDNGSGTIKVKDSIVRTNAKMQADGDIALKGIYVGKDLTISKANNVLISNSDRKPLKGVPTIAGLAQGMPPVTDYNRARFNNASFTDFASDFGVPYGAGTRISYIGGNANISNTKSVTIINTAIEGNLTESNITGDSGLIYSYVGGDYTTDGPTSARDESVFESYIKGKFTRRYPDNTNFDDVNKLRYGSQLDTIFRQQFNPRGFAASDDEIKVMKRNTISSLMRGKGGNNANSFNITKGFYAY